MAGPRRSPWPLVLCLAIVGLVHLRALGGELVYDDLQMIARNPGIRDLRNVPSFFQSGYWDFLETPGAATTGYWRPLTATCLAVAHALGGGSTEGFHAASLVVHLLATWAAWAVALRLSRSAFVAFFASFLFGLHPLQVESTAWITALNDPLFAMLGLASVASFLRWRERGSPGVPLLAAALFGLALTAKELAVAILPILWIADLLRPQRKDDLGRPWKVLRPADAPWRAYAPFALLLVLYYLARVLVFGEPTAGLERVTTYFGVPWQRLALLRLELLGGGLRLCALPIGLNVFRPFRPGLAWLDPTALAAAGAVLAWAALLALAWRGKRRAEVAALLIAPAGMLPMLVRVASLGRFPLSDRFLYVPVLGFTLYAALCARRLLGPRAAALALGALGALYAAGTWTRIAVWRDEEALFRSALDADPRSPYAHWGLGRVLLARYQETGDTAHLAEAFQVYERAKDLLEEALADRAGTDLFVSGIDVLQVELGFAWCLVLEAQIDAFHDYGTPIKILEGLLDRILAIRTDVDRARALGLRVQAEPLEVEQVQVALGVAHMLAGDAAAAESAFRAALIENEAHPEAHHNLARLLLSRGDADRARAHFQRALELRPDSRKDRLGLAEALLAGGWYDRAEAIARAAVEDDAKDVDALMILATAAQARGDWAGSLRWLDAIDAAGPPHGYAQYRRARALVELARPADALQAFRRAAELLPDAFDVRYDFGAYLLRQGAQETAIPHLVAAYGLARDADRYLALRETLRGLALAPEDLVQLGVSDRARGQSESARAWLERAVELDPESGEARLHLGRVRRDLHDLAGAAESLAAAAERMPAAFAPRFELGVTLRDLGRHEEALAALRESRDLGPPASWGPEESASMTRKLEELIRELEAAGPLVGPRAGD